MTRTIIANYTARRGFLVLAALLVVIAALGPLAMKSASAVHGDEPTVTVEKLSGLTSYPDDVSAVIKLRLTKDSEANSAQMLESRWPKRPNGTQLIHVRDFDNVLMAKITFEDQAIINWHTHPGPAVVTVAEGALTITNANDCVPREYGTGNGFIDPGHGNVHMAKANGPTVVYVTFFEVPDDGVTTIPVDFKGCS